MAKKPSVTTVSSGFASNTQLNANFTALRDAFDNTLSLDGSSPNAMGADLDLNNNDLLNASVVNTATLKIGGVNVVPSAAAALAIKKEFNTVAALLADTGTYSSYAENDYLRVVDGGFTYRVAASGASDQHVTTAGGVKLYVLKTGFSSPYVAGQYNIHPSNSGSMNHAAIQNALDKLETAGGGSLDIPPGNYSVAFDINMRNNTGLKGSNQGFWAKAPGNGSRLSLGDGKSIIFAEENASVQGFFINVSASSQVPLVRFDTAAPVGSCSLKNCTLNGGYYEQLDTSSSIACVFEDLLLINGLTGRNTFSTYRGAMLAGGTDNFFHRIEANATSGFSGISATGYAGAIVLEGSNNWLTDCISELSDFGLYTKSGSHHRVTAHRSDLNFGHGIILGSAAVTFSGVDCVNNANTSPADTYSGVIAIGNAKGAMRNLTVMNLDRPRLLYAVDLNLASDATPDFSVDLVNWNNVLNVVRTNNFNPASVTLAAKISRTTVTSGTLDVNGASKFILSASSPQTITALTGGYFGQEVEIISESANVTLGHNSGTTDPKIFLNSLANFTFGSPGYIRRFRLVPRGGSAARWIEV